MARTVGELAWLLERDQVEFVRFELPDIHGISRGKTLQVKAFLKAMKKGFNMFLVPWTPQVDLIPALLSHPSMVTFSDSFLKPDPTTYMVLPWADKTARVICSIDNGPYKQCSPRNILQTQLASLEALGLNLMSGWEREFYVVDEVTKKGIYSGKNILSTIRNFYDEAWMNKLFRTFSQVGMDMMTAHSEYGPGQMEFACCPALGIKSADDAMMFTTGVKEMAHKQGKMATFMTKPFPDGCSSGTHCGLSLVNVDGSEDRMYDPETNDLTQDAKHFIAGILKHGAGITALCCPTVNCGRRFVTESFFPTIATWGYENRTALLRAKVSGPGSTYLENRLPSGSVNHYLCLAATVAAGVDGLANKLPCPDAIEGVANDLSKNIQNAAVIPARLEPALQALEADSVLCEALGQEFVTIFCAMKREELRIAMKQEGKEAIETGVDPTKWEMDMYFEFL